MPIYSTCTSMFATHRLVLGQHLWRLPWERCSVDRCPRLALGLARTAADVRDVLMKRGWTSRLRLLSLARRARCQGQNASKGHITIQMT